MAIVIATDDAGHGFVDGNNSGGAVAAEMGELDGLEAHGDFLIYSWPAKAFWLNVVTKFSIAATFSFGSKTLTELTILENCS